MLASNKNSINLMCDTSRLAVNCAWMKTWFKTRAMETFGRELGIDVFHPKSTGFRITLNGAQERQDLLVVNLETFGKLVTCATGFVNLGAARNFTRRRVRTGAVDVATKCFVTRDGCKSKMQLHGRR